VEGLARPPGEALVAKRVVADLMALRQDLAQQPLSPPYPLTENVEGGARPVPTQRLENRLGYPSRPVVEGQRDAPEVARAVSSRGEDGRQAGRPVVVAALARRGTGRARS